MHEHWHHLMKYDYSYQVQKGKNNGIDIQWRNKCDLHSNNWNSNHVSISFVRLCTGVGVGMTRDTSTLMVAQYFKRKREFVEIIILSASGVGLAVSSLFLNGAIGYSRPM